MINNFRPRSRVIDFVLLTPMTRKQKSRIGFALLTLISAVGTASCEAVISWVGSPWLSVLVGLLSAILSIYQSKAIDANKKKITELWNVYAEVSKEPLEREDELVELKNQLKDKTD